VLSAWVVGIALVILVVALLSGPYRWAVAVRSFVARTWHRVVREASPERRERLIASMASHANGLQLVGAVVAGVLLLIVSVSWLSFLIVGALLAVFEIFLQSIKPRSPDEIPPGAGSGPGLDVPA